MVFLVPESPRWLVSKGRHREAFESLIRFRNSHLQAARDLFYMSILLEEEQSIASSRNRFFELFTIPRNRRALLASSIVMWVLLFDKGVLEADKRETGSCRFVFFPK